MLPRSAQYLITHRHLLWRTTLNELRSKYAGSLLGIAWAVVSPWLILSLYAVVYLFIFRLRVEGLGPTEYVLFVFAGLIPFFMTGEALGFGVASVVMNRDVLENTVFPIDLTPARAVLMAQASMIAGLPVVVLGTLIFIGLDWTALALPLIWFLHVMALMGILWPLSLLNVVFRDLQSVISIVLMALLIASPFAYTPDMVPDQLRFIVAFNPLAYFVMAYQAVLVLHECPSLKDWTFMFVFSFGMFFLGSWFFGRAKQVVIDYV